MPNEPGADEAAWDDEAWRERNDIAWTAGCRWMQSRWCHEQLGFPAGERRARPGSRKVASMLPLESDPALNLMSPGALEAAIERLSVGSGAGIVAKDRLYRNLLSSQPMCFNLFGPFVEDPSGLLRWVRSLDSDCVEVTGVRFEWAPDPAGHFRGGSAFDAMVDYVTASGRRFLGVECKYAEDLSKNRIRVREPYIEFTRDSGHWMEGAERRLDVRNLRQFWLNTLLVQSLVDREDTYEAGSCVVMACAADRSAGLATYRVRSELADPDRWLKWSPYESIIGTLDPGEQWVSDFTARYLDFGRVEHKLDGSDSRLSEPEVEVHGLNDLEIIGRRVVGDGSVLEQVNRSVGNLQPDAMSQFELESLNERAADLAEDLRTFRESMYGIWSNIERQ